MTDAGDERDLSAQFDAGGAKQRAEERACPYLPILR